MRQLAKKIEKHDEKKQSKPGMKVKTNSETVQERK